MALNQPTYEELLQQLQEKEQKLQLVEQELEESRNESRSTSYKEALRLWHTLYSDPNIHYPAGKVATSDFTSAPKRLRPKTLRPWDGFNQLHRQAWNEIVQALNSSDNKLFDPKSTYEAEANRFMPKLVLRHENQLVAYLERTLEEHVASIAERIGSSMTFKDQEKNSLADVTSRIDNMDLEDRPSTPPTRRRYDKVCSVTEAQGERPVLVVEYKAAHKLCPALMQHLEPVRPFELDDIIHRHKVAAREDERQREIAEEVLAVVITQTFDYMINQGLSYGYATGGQAFLFLHYDAEDAQTVYYHCQTVSSDMFGGGGVDDDHDEDMFRETAVGLVSAFARLAALNGWVKGSNWIKQMREALPVWMVDDEVLMANFTPSPVAVVSKRKNKKSRSPAFRGKGGPWSKELERTTRSKTKAKLAGCSAGQEVQGRRRKREDDEDDSSEGGKENDGRTQELEIQQTQTAQWQREPQGSSKSRHDQGQDIDGSSKGAQYGSFCTQACLLGLVRGGSLDWRCPNVRAHSHAGGRFSNKHHMIDGETFLKLLEDQLGQVPRDDGFQSLDRSGWAGALFWVRLRSHGYTFVAKGTVDALVPVLRKEARMYERMRAIQGRAVPVYLGSIDMTRPFYLCSGVLIVHLMLLSWGGQVADDCGLDPARLRRETERTVLDVRRLGVDQGDLRGPNILWNEELSRAMLIDFDFAKLHNAAKDGIGERTRTLAERDGNIVSKKKAKRIEGSLM